MASARTLSPGIYPEVTLKSARDRRDSALQHIAAGIDPALQKRAERLSRAGAESFEAVARDCFHRNAESWAKTHSSKVIARLENDIFPWLGRRPVVEITAQELLAAVRRIESRGALRPAKGTHLAAVTDPAEVGALLRQMEQYHGSFVVRCAVHLAPLVFVRPGKLRGAKWADIDLDAAEWRYLFSKTRSQHIVPLSLQSLQILREINPLTCNGVYVVPNERSPRGDRPMSDNAVLTAFRTTDVGKETMSGHSWRACARTILNEVLGFRVELIEQQLAHAVRDPGRAYNRTAHLPERKAMMQAWADYLDQLKAGAHSNVIPMRKT